MSEYRQGGGGHGHPCCCCGRERAEEQPVRAHAGYEDHGGAQTRGAPGGGAGADGYGAGPFSALFGGAGTGQSVGTGALIAAGVMLLAANREKLKPVVKGTMKEYYRFSDWLGSNFAQVKEDLSDVAAEARHDYEQEMAAHLELLEKERQTVQRLANMAKKRSEES
jgi:hypothetical protein